MCREKSWVQRGICDVRSSDANNIQSPASTCSLILVTRLPHFGTMRGRQWGFVPSFSEAAQSASPAEGSVEETEARESPLTTASALRRSWTGSMHCEQHASTTCRWLSQEPVMQM